MAYCKRCKEQVKTSIRFDSNNMMYLVCQDCSTELSDRTDDDNDDFYESDFMNQFGDSN